MAALAAVGCGSEVASGGECGPGALSGAVGSLSSHLPIGEMSSAGKLAVVTVSGGLASVAGGGKFGNGAVTAAFGYLYNSFELALQVVGGVGGGALCAGSGPGSLLCGLIGRRAGAYVGNEIDRALGIEDWYDGILWNEGQPPPNLSPEGAGRRGAFNEAKRLNGIPTSQQPNSQGPNLDRNGNPQPGRRYDFNITREGGGTSTVTIRDDAAGHFYGRNNPQNRGPHFNDPLGRHFDY
jgi:hypothetical protein